MKKIFWLLSSWFVVLLLSYSLMEATALRWLPHVFSIATVMRYLDIDAQLLAQYSKSGAMPEKYVAVLGDSYAFGLGDWLFNEQSTIAPTYNTTHLLHKKLKQDVVSFGIPASSSIKGYIEDPVSHLTFIRSLNRGSIDNPQIALLYYYEGNDVTDNFQEFTVRYQGKGFDPALLNDDKYFTEFIDKSIIAENKIVKRSKDGFFTDKLLFGRFVISLVKGEPKEFLKKLREKIDDKPHRPIFKRQPVDHNVITVAGEKHFIPDGLQVPPVAMNPEELAISMTILDKTLRYVKKMWPNTQFGLVYVPAVSTAYNVVSDTVNIYDTNRGKNYASSLLLPASDAACLQVQKITSTNDIYFLDARPAIRQVAQQKFIHGPKDWLHFNEAGYRVLAQELEVLMAQMETSRTTTNCANLTVNPQL